MTERLDAFLSYGFRPFFLFAGIYAVVGMAAWMAWIGLHAAHAEVFRMSTDFPPFQWHAHEMLFGYTAAEAMGLPLVNLIPQIAPTSELQRKLLVDNPASLYGFER